MEKTTRQKNDWRSLLPSTRLSSSANGLRRDIRLRQPKDTLISRKMRSLDEEPAVADGAFWAASELGGDIWGDSLPMDDEGLAVEAQTDGESGVRRTKKRRTASKEGCSSWGTMSSSKAKVS